MYKSYLVVAFRNILRQKTLNVLNVLGLSIGIAAGLIIAIHIRGELSYESSFPNYENIYRIHGDGWATTSPALAGEFREFFHDVESIGNFLSFGERVVTTDRNNPGEAIGYYADSAVMNIFDMKVVDGDPAPLVAMNSVVITQSMASRFFGDESPIGKKITFGNGAVTKILKFDPGRDMTVTAVVKDLPANSHLSFDYLVSMSTFNSDANTGIEHNRNIPIMYTYFRAKPGTFKKISEAMPKFIRKYFEGTEDADKKVTTGAWRLMPLKDIHLHSHLEKEMSPNSNIIYVYVFMAIELLILLIASANFMILFTTQALRRVKEVGMRKIMGAKPRQIVLQFLMDISLLTFASLLIAMLIYQFVLPFYNELSGKSIDASEVFRIDTIATIGIIAVIVLSVAGVYPMLFVSGFKVGSFLHENKLPRSLPNLMRNAMVVFQFVVSVSLIAATIIVNQQMQLMKNRDLGFDKDQVINVKLYGHLREMSSADGEAFKNEFLKDPNVLPVARAGRLIGERWSVESVVPQGRDEDVDDIPAVRVVRVDEGYLDAMNIKLLEGRNFSREINDSVSYIINESAVKALGLSDPVDQILNNRSRRIKGKIVGVIKDFHYATFHSSIEPLIMEYEPGWADNLVIKIRQGTTTETLGYIKNTVSKLAPNSLFMYQFLDDRVDALYRSEETMSKIFRFFSVLAITIACLGLFGLSSYTIEMKTKEIGIRKVLGATACSIVTLLYSSVFRLIAIGVVIAIPVSWYAMNKWLNNFAYKIEIEWYVFAIAGLVVVVVAAMAVGFRTIHAALANPVKALRRE